MQIKTTIFAAALIAATPFVATSMAHAHNAKAPGYGNGGFASGYTAVRRALGHKHGHKHVRKAKRTCVAVGKRARGFGARLPATRRTASAFRMPVACRVALNKCRTALRFRKSRGRVPFASCKVVRRF